MLDNNEIRLYGKQLETLFLHLVCLSFMLTSLHMSLLYWTVRVLILGFTFVLLLFNIQANSKGIVFYALLIIMSCCLCVVNQHAIHCLLIISTLLLLNRIELEKFIVVNFFYILATYFLVLVLSKIGYIQPDYKIIKTGETVNIFCFENPNRLGSFLFSIYLFFDVFLLIKNRIFIANIIGIPYSIYIYNVSGCRTVIIAVFVQTICWVLLSIIKKNPILRNFAKYITGIMPLFLLLFSFLFAKYASVGIFFLLDLVLGRGTYLKPFVDLYSLPALFVGVNFTTEEPIDNSYLYILLSTNVIIYYALCKFVKKNIQCFNAKDIVTYIPLIMSLFAYGMTESLLGYYSYVAMLFFFLIMKIPYRSK